MRRRIYIGLTAFLTVLCSCADAATDISGTWMRPVSEADLGVSGTERLSLGGDSVFTDTNDLTLAYSDSTFECRLRFRTSVTGVWSLDGDSLMLSYRPTTFGIDTVVGGVSLSSKRGILTDSVRNAMTHDLVGRLSLYYRAVYEEMQAPHGLRLTGVCTAGDLLVARLADSTAVQWDRVTP